MFHFFVARKVRSAFDALNAGDVQKLAAMCAAQAAAGIGAAAAAPITA